MIVTKLVAMCVSLWKYESMAVCGYSIIVLSCTVVKTKREGDVGACQRRKEESERDGEDICCRSAEKVVGGGKGG